MVLTSRHLLKILLDAGVIPPETRRVVLDLTVDKPPVLYVEQFGTDALIKLLEATTELVIATEFVGNKEEEQVNV